MQPGSIAITEKFLSGAGGWQALKAARELVQAGRVAQPSYQSPLLVGEVREGQKRYRAGLRIRSASDVENLCTCRESREWGKICAHSLAVGLAWLAPAAPPPPDHERPKPDDRFVPLGEAAVRPLALHFILPPNFRDAWARQRLQVCVEAELSGRRLMFDALPPGEAFGCDEFDLAALASLGRDIGSAMTLSGADFLRWLSSLRGHPRISLGKGVRARIEREIFRPEIELRPEGEAWKLAARFATEESPLLAGSEAWLWRGESFREIGRNLPARLTNVLRAPWLLPAGQTDEFFALELPAWREFAEVKVPSGSPLPTAEEAAPEFSCRVEGSMQLLRARLLCHYGNRPPFPPLEKPQDRFAFRPTPGSERLLLRNLQAETEAAARLDRAGFSRTADGFEMRDPRRIARFFAFDYPALPPAWEITVSPRLEKAGRDLEPLRPTIEIVRSGEDWFELKYSVATADGEGISLAEVQRLLRSGQTQARLTNGKVAVFDPEALEDFEEMLRDADPRQSQPGLYRLPTMQAAYLTNTAEDIGARLVGVSSFLRSERNLPPVGPLGARLRDYQQSGVRWLAALAAQGLGGILADEMGLGKTVQALAFLQLDRGHGPALIVCPTSLLANWQREAARFSPELQVRLIEGAERAEKIARIADADLALTSYGLLRRDIDHYAGLALRTVILDEAQHIKNPETQNAQAAFRLAARQRFVLTGTPVENSVRDLWSLLNFVAPGYLGSRADFRERYEKPLAGGPEPVVQRRLARRLRPFLLRRRKAEVVQELPEKIEQIVPCDLSPRQRATYDTFLREIQQGLRGPNNGEGATRMKMLTGLLRLRQICCDLRLLGLPPNEDGQTSAKLDLFDELLEEIIDGGHRALVFSQFVQMLGLLRTRLAARGTAFCYLAGETKDRQKEVDRFQNDEGIPVFLISLKAGGVGLNLSAADSVIHFDPWWNAAVEAQATDRAHRIGQKRVVTSYKLIARDTVEEKILNLQKRKRELASAMLESEEPLMAGLTTDDLAELLST